MHHRVVEVQDQSDLRQQLGQEITMMNVGQFMTENGSQLIWLPVAPVARQ